MKRHAGGDQIEALDHVIAPACHEQVAVKFSGEIRAAGVHGAGRFTGRRNHRQRAGNFTVPGDEGVNAFAPVAKAETVIAILDDVQQAARRAAVGVVIDGEHAAGLIEAEAERVPESGRDFFELPALERAAVDVAALAAAAQSGAVAASDFVIRAEVFAEAEVEPAVRAEGESGESVVRIVAGGAQSNQRLAFGGRFSAVFFAHQNNFGARAEIYPTLFVEQNRHGIFKAAGEGADFARAAIRGEVVKNLNAVAGEAFVILGREVRVVFDHPDAPARINGQSSGRDNLRLLRDELQRKTRVAGHRDVERERGQRERDDKQKRVAGHTVIPWGM